MLEHIKSFETFINEQFEFKGKDLNRVFLRYRIFAERKETGEVEIWPIPKYFFKDYGIPEEEKEAGVPEILKVDQYMKSLGYILRLPAVGYIDKLKRTQRFIPDEGNYLLYYPEKASLKVPVKQFLDPKLKNQYFALYHISPIKNLKKILTTGISAKANLKAMETGNRTAGVFVWTAEDPVFNALFNPRGFITRSAFKDAKVTAVGIFKIRHSPSEEIAYRDPEYANPTAGAALLHNSVGPNKIKLLGVYDFRETKHTLTLIKNELITKDEAEDYIKRKNIKEPPEINVLDMEYDAWIELIKNKY